METTCILLLSGFLVAAGYVVALLFLQHKTMNALQTLTDSVNGLNTSVSNLATSVDKAVTELNAENATDAQLNTLASAVDALKTNIDAQTARLEAAVTPVVVVDPPTPTGA